MVLSTRLAAAAALVVVIALGGAYVLGSTSTQVAHSPTPSATSVPSASATRQPSVTTGPSPTLVPGTSLAVGIQKLVAETSYSIADFDPAFSIKAQQGWWLLGAGPGHAWFANGPNEPNPPDNYEFSILVANLVLPPGQSSGVPLPSDLVGWLQARPDLVLGAPQVVTVGGIHGTALTGTVRVGAATNGGGAINLICPAETVPCQWDRGGALGVGVGQPFELIVLPVRGKVVVIGMAGGSPTWSMDTEILDPLLAGLSFPGLTN